MAITYKSLDWMPSVRLPIMHRVIYAHTTDGVQAMYQRSYLDHLVDEWLRTNCKSLYYHSPGYLIEKFVQFEDDQEATQFAWFILGQ